MRSGWLAAGLLLPLLLAAQVRINELQCTRLPGTDGRLANGDWVELVNLGRKALDLQGYCLTVEGHMARIPAGMPVMPGEHKVFWCGKDPGSLDRLPLKLPRRGSTLLLVAPDGATVLDVFTWPALPPGTSIGRTANGAAAWGYFAEPTPGAPNGQALARLLAPPRLQRASVAPVLTVPPGAEVRYTTDGSLPQPGSARYERPLQVVPGTLVQACALAPGAVPSTAIWFTAGLPDTAWSLALDPADLHGEQGIADTASGNHARKGRQWQRQAWLQRGDRVEPVGVSIAGSGSRSLPKRNFHLLVRDRFTGMGPIALPDGSAWRTLLLRADATPHAFLRNVFMHEVAHRSGDRVDVQPWAMVPFFLNGADQGLYRAMPSKGKEWLRSLNHGLPVEVMDPTASDTTATGRLSWFGSARAGGHAEDSLDRLLDVESLLELACFDLWTGRADHDINVRAWRPPQGRWRWVLYDMDLWAPPDDHTLARMCGSMLPEAPFLPQILADAGLRDLFLARFSALCATTLGPDRAAALADSLFLRHHAALTADHVRWRSEMPSPPPAATYSDLLDHIASRNGELFGQLTAMTGRTTVSVAVRVVPPGAGRVMVEDLFLTSDRREMRVFKDVPLHLVAQPGAGMEFQAWQGVPQNGPAMLLAPGGKLYLQAVFRPQALSRQGGL
ncbi:MAG: CotH kinase family protein [Flavobacteriales bacterium]|nr:CotH kinase family protein [Flavobacteriales bacterium]